MTNYTHRGSAIKEEHFITKEPELAYYRDGKAQQSVFKGLKLEGGWQDEFSNKNVFTI